MHHERLIIFSLLQAFYNVYMCLGQQKRVLRMCLSKLHISILPLSRTSTYAYAHFIRLREALGDTATAAYVVFFYLAFRPKYNNILHKLCHTYRASDWNFCFLLYKLCWRYWAYMEIRIKPKLPRFALNFLGLVVRIQTLNIILA